MIVPRLVRHFPSLAAVLLIGTSAHAQLPVPDAPPVDAVVAGRVVTPGRERELGMPNVMVTVHRVGPDSAGALDSARTDAGGRYRIRYRRFGSDEAVYFAAALHHGIAYFSSPLRGQRASADDAERPSQTVASNCCGSPLQAAL